jgi:hypothetical protein
VGIFALVATTFVPLRGSNLCAENAVLFFTNGRSAKGGFMSSARLSRAFKTLAAFALCVFSVQSLAEPSCKGDGGMHAANAFVAANPLYSMYFDFDLRSYLAKNRGQFRQGGNAVRCMAALSKGFMSAAYHLYDPQDAQMKQQVDLQMGSIGFGPGAQQPTASSGMLGVSMQLGRLARVSPAAADGDYGPMNTPTNEIEQMQLVAESILRQLMPPDMFKQIMAPHDQLMRTAFEFDHYLVLQAAQRLAKAK